MRERTTRIKRGDRDADQFFLTPAQRENHGRYATPPTPDQLSRFFHLNDEDLAQIRSCRGEHNRLGFALQLSTVRYLGTFLEGPVAVPSEVVRTLADQLGISKLDNLPAYRAGKQRWEHAAQIQINFGYSDITEPPGWVSPDALALRALLDWNRTPSVLFDHAATWLLAHKILLPGCSTLKTIYSPRPCQSREPVVALVGTRYCKPAAHASGASVSCAGRRRGSLLDQIRSGPTRVSGQAMRAAVDRLKSIRELGIDLPAVGRIPESRIASLAHFASRAKVSLITRMPSARRLATLAAFVYSLEATAQDDVLEVFESLLADLFGDAEKADKKARLRTLKGSRRSNSHTCACLPLAHRPGVARRPGPREGV